MGDDFKQTIDKLENDANAQREKDAIKRQQAREISQFQLKQKAEQSARFKEEDDQLNAKMEQKWPYRTEEQVKEHTQKLNSDFRTGLDMQMSQSGRSLGLSQSRSNNNNKSSKRMTSSLKSSMAETHNVFPKFLNPEKGVTMAHYPPADVYEATMSYTFKNLDAKLNADTKSMEVAEDDIQKRKERSELLHKKREVERMRERNELNEFLKEQARYK